MKIAYITNGMASTLNSSFELAYRLRDAGHKVVYLSPADVGEPVEAEGFQFVRLTGDRRYQDAAAEPVSPSSPLRWWRALSRRRSARLDSIENDEIERTIARLAPDLLLIDIEMHFAVIATAASGLPTLLPIVWFSIFRRPGLPPLHTDLPAPTSFARRLTIRLAWWRLRLETLHGEWRDRLQRIVRGDVFRPIAYDTFSITDLRAVARSRGFDLGRETDRSHWLRPYAYTRKPVLCFNVREMELPHGSWPELHYVGPMVRRERAETRLAPESAAKWRQLAATRVNEDNLRPLVYCSLGTFWSMDQSFLRRVLDVFARRPDWDLVLGLGGKLDRDALAPLPENALVLDYAPQLEVLELADCAITHGGITTINECIEMGVPMVVYSTRHVDQNGCAVRVAHHGLGVIGDKDADDVEALESNIDRALTDPDLKARVAAMQQCFRGYRNEALRVIERQLERTVDS